MGASTTMGAEASKPSKTTHDAGVSGSSNPTLLKWAREANAADITPPTGTRHPAVMNRSHDGVDHNTSTLASRYRPISPPNLRQTFRADRRDDWSSPRNGRSNSPGSPPDDTWSRRRGDRWEPPPRRWSPVGETASLRRASLGRRASPPRNHTSASPPHLSGFVSESARGAGSSNGDVAEKGIFQNKKWIAPHLQSVPRHNVQQPTRLHGARSPVVDEAPPAQTIRNKEWGGIKGVPTGPKADSHVVPDLAAIKISPHIFIPWRSLPAKRGTIKHLHGFLRPHTRKESNIHLDDDGWYIYLGDSEASRHTLKDCHDSKNGAKMFSTYTLDMHYYPHGQPATRKPRPFPSEEDVADTGALPDQTETSPQERRLEESMLRQPPQSINGKTTDQQPAAAAEAGSELPEESAVVQGRQSSPLRVPSRQDKDDALSCISGFTGSDISSSRRLKCHVCQKGTSIDLEPLVCCSSCPRRYHRRCHDRSPIPFHLDEGHTWRCRRCIRKEGTTSGTRLTQSSPVLKRSREKNLLSSEERPTKMMRLESPFNPIASLEMDSLRKPVKAPNPSNDGGQSPAVDIADPNPGQLPADDIDPAPSNEGGQSPAFGIADSKPDHPPADNIGLTEANDLVAKSFDLPRSHEHEQSHSPRPSQPLKLRLVRKKIVDAAPPSSPSASILRSPLVPTSIVQATNGTSAASVDGEANDDDLTQKAKSPPHRHEDNKSINQDRSEKNSDLSLSNGVDGDVDMTDAPAKGAAVTVVGIPESPEEHRRQDEDEQLTSTEMVKLKISDTEEVTRQPAQTGLADVGTAQSNSNTPRGQMPTVKMKRIRPGAPTFAKCVRCGKTTASGPSGSNKLCSRCKSDAVARQAPGSPQTITVERKEKSLPGSPGLRQSIRMEQPTGKPASVPIASTEAVAIPAQPEEPSTETTAPAAISTPVADSPAATIPDPKVAIETTTATPVSRVEGVDTAGNPLDLENHGRELATSSTACPSCRARHRRCFHTNGIADRLARIMEPLRDEESTNDDLSSPPESHDDQDDVESSPKSESEMDVGHSTNTENEESTVIKRRTQTRPAIHEHDLGDSYTRPKGAYEKLIGMALCAAANHRLKATDITAWVVKNIPGYSHGEGKWENSLRATLTLKREGYEFGKPGLWRKVEVGLKLNEACLWELLPGQAEKLMHWDPVLKQPVSPPKVWLKIPNVRRAEEETNGKQKKSLPNTATPMRSADKAQASSSKKRRRPSRRRSTLSDAEPLATGAAPDTVPKRSIKSQPIVIDDSSDEEPLLTQERRQSHQLQTSKDVPPAEAVQEDAVEMMDVDGDMPTPDMMDVDAGDPVVVPLTNRQSHPSEEPAGEPMAPASTLARARHSERLPSFGPRTEIPTIEDMVEMSRRNTTYDAKDLLSEWPELKTQNSFDRSAKIAEIKLRPTKKERFGRQNPLAEFELVEDNQATGKSNEHRATNGNTASEKKLAILYPWENTEDNVVECSSLQELFNLPNNPMAIIHDGNLAYRDGTRAVDGSLPRAKVIYKTDYYTR